MSTMAVEPFVQRLPKPHSAPFEAIAAALGAGVVRWAVVAVEAEAWIVEGARLVPCSTSSI
ncbi:MAG TPA: hypothetical protein V6D47_07675 [Oscillatoriaceae cyanobacterium]